MDEALPVSEMTVEDHLQEIAQARERLEVALQKARQEFCLNPLDWRAWVNRYPVQTTLSAVAVGFFVSNPSVLPRSGERTLLDHLSRVGFDTAIRLLIRNLT